MLLNSKKFYGEDKCRIRLDFATGVSIAVCQLIRDVKFPLWANRHHQKCLCPTANHLIYTKSNGFATLVAAIEHCTVDEFAFIVYFCFLRSGRLLASSLCDNLVLQAASCSYNTWLSLVFFKEFFGAFGLLFSKKLNGKFFDNPIIHHPPFLFILTV